MNWNIKDDTACDSPVDVPWLSVSPDSGATAAMDSTDVDVTFDSTGMPAGNYAGNLCVSSNDPTAPPVIVPVELTVEPGDEAAVYAATVTLGDHVDTDGDGVLDNCPTPSRWGLRRYRCLAWSSGTSRHIQRYHRHALCRCTFKSPLT